MTIYISFLGTLGLVTFCWGIYYTVRNPHSGFGLPGLVVACSWIVSLLLYGFSVLNLLPMLESMTPAVKFFSLIGAVLLFFFCGWLGHLIAEDLNHSDYIAQLHRQDSQIKAHKVF